MDKIAPGDILQVSVNLYSMIGESRRDNSKLLYLIRVFNSVMLTIAMVFTSASFANVQRGLYVESMEGAVTALHILIKYICFIYYKQNIQDLVSNTKSFWNRTGCDPKLSRNMRKIHRYVGGMQKFTATLSFANFVMISLRPAFNDRMRFIFHAWVPLGNIVWETVVLFSQFHLIMVAVPIVLGCDFLYVSVTLHMISQLRLLSYELEHMKRDVDSELIREWVRQHRLILAMFDQIKNIFFWLLLFHYFVTLISGCTQMYLVAVGNTKSMDLFINSVHLFVIVLQFSYYAGPIELVVSELRHISTAIYMSSWYERDEKQRNLLLFIMMKSQQQRYLSLGGFMDMNLDAFGSVLRKIFSFCAILQNIIH